MEKYNLDYKLKVADFKIVGRGRSDCNVEIFKWVKFSKFNFKVFPFF